MNSLISSVLATGAAAAVAVTVFGLPDFGPGVAHDEITGSVRDGWSGSYSLDRGIDTDCSIRRGAQITPMVYQLETKGRCESVLEGFDVALFWTDTASGGVVISGSSGAILEFAEADGEALESISPASPLFSLTLDRD